MCSRRTCEMPLQVCRSNGPKTREKHPKSLGLFVLAFSHRLLLPSPTFPLSSSSVQAINKLSTRQAFQARNLFPPWGHMVRFGSRHSLGVVDDANLRPMLPWLKRVSWLVASHRPGGAPSSQPWRPRPRNRKRQRPGHQKTRHRLGRCVVVYLIVWADSRKLIGACSMQDRFGPLSCARSPPPPHLPQSSPAASVSISGLV